MEFWKSMTVLRRAKENAEFSKKKKKKLRNIREEIWKMKWSGKVAKELNKWEIWREKEKKKNKNVYKKGVVDKSDKREKREWGERSRGRVSENIKQMERKSQGNTEGGGRQEEEIKKRATRESNCRIRPFYLPLILYE